MCVNISLVQCVWLNNSSVVINRSANYRLLFAFSEKDSSLVQTNFSFLQVRALVKLALIKDFATAIGVNYGTYTLRKKGSSMVLQNGQKFYLEPFAIWTRLKDLQTILSCEEPLKVLHFPVKNPFFWECSFSGTLLKMYKEKQVASVHRLLRCKSKPLDL